jgi:hypothetical protein
MSRTKPTPETKKRPKLIVGDYFRTCGNCYIRLEFGCKDEDEVSRMRGDGPNQCPKHQYRKEAEKNQPKSTEPYRATKLGDVGRKML